MTEIGRNRFIGLGKQAVIGTKSAAIEYFPHNGGSINPKRGTINDESARGSRIAVSAVDTIMTNSEPTLGGITFDSLIGIILHGTLGQSTTTVDSPEAGVNTHKFTVLDNNSTFPVYTAVAKDGVHTKMSLDNVFNKLAFKIDKSKYVEYSTDLIGKFEEATTEVPVFTDENRFVSAKTIVKIAADAASLDAAPEFVFESADISFDNKVKASSVTSDLNPGRIYPNTFSIDVTFTAVFDSATEYDKWEAETKQAIRFTMVNDNVTIGAATNPSLAIEASNFKYSEVTKSDGIDEEVIVTFKVQSIIKAGEDYVSATLVNTHAAY